MVLAYLVATTALVVGAGRLGDIVGRKRLMLFGLALFIGGSLAGALAASLPVLVAARILQGVGAASMIALSVAMVGEVVPRSRTGRAMGLLGTASAVGTALGPSLGGLLLSAFSWPAIFLASADLGTVALVFVEMAVPQSSARPQASRSRLDFSGTLLLAIALSFYALAMT